MQWELVTTNVVISLIISHLVCLAKCADLVFSVYPSVCNILLIMHNTLCSMLTTQYTSECTYSTWVVCCVRITALPIVSLLQFITIGSPSALLAVLNLTLLGHITKHTLQLYGYSKYSH